ncbi:hypothetical protein VE00_08144 [Pseudogymnoascus sp. WSF 3629]|nr:hypothetical protein VE00_08144 [Pseudogymnoascus sp. WSF 3629]
MAFSVWIISRPPSFSQENVSFFLSNCWIPDVKPNTKIVGICGITDWNKENDPKLPGRAAPNQEGWHFADFYLFHHMLKEVAYDQVWVTCVSPETAVEKYGRYVYGDYTPKKIENRRVVLEESMLGELYDVRTASPEDLLRAALTTISKACIQATDEGRPVLILIFSPGSERGYSIAMGGTNAEDPNALTKDLFRQGLISSSNWVSGTGSRAVFTCYRIPHWKISRGSGLANQRDYQSAYRRYSLLKDATPGYDELLAVVKSEAEVYLNSFPGLDYKGKNLSLHNELRGTIRGTRVPSLVGLEYLRCQIDYRLSCIMKMATAYEDLWGLTMKNCEDTEVEIGAGIGTYRWIEVLKLVQFHDIFDKPNGDQGYEYSKGDWYITSCIHSQGWDNAQVEEKLQSLLRYKVTRTLIFLFLRRHSQLTETLGPNESGPGEPIVCSQRQQDCGFSFDQEFSALEKEAKQYFDSKLRTYDCGSDTSLHGPLYSILDGTKEDTSLGV